MPPQDFRDPRLLASRLSELQAALPGVNVPLLVAEEPHLLHVDIQGVLANCRWGDRAGKGAGKRRRRHALGRDCVLWGRPGQTHTPASPGQGQARAHAVLPSPCATQAPSQVARMNALLRRYRCSRFTPLASLTAPGLPPPPCRRLMPQMDPVRLLVSQPQMVLTAVEAGLSSAMDVEGGAHTTQY